MNKKSAHSPLRREVTWKVAHNRIKIKNKTKLAIFMLLLITGIVLIGNLLRFTQNLFQPVSETIKKQYSWDGNSRMYLIIKSNTVSVLSFDPYKKEVAIVNIPGDANIEVPGGYGSWQVRSIYDLGQSENPPKGVKLLNQSLSLYLGLPIDGYIQTDSLTVEKVVGDFSTPLGIKDLLSNIKTDLSPVELVKLSLGLSRVRFDKINNINMSDIDAIESQLSRGVMADSQLQSDLATIAIFNATDKPGLAAQVARMITNMGGNVVIQTSADKVEKTFIAGKDSYTKKRLSQLFCSGGNCAKIASSSSDFRAQINIVLGNDFVTR